jgi:hypothetical protein
MHRPSLATRIFPAPSRFSTESEDPVTRAAWRPLLATGAERVSRIRWMQQGQLPLYVVYIPGATGASTGLAERPKGTDPWIMFPGTPKAHIMFSATMQ